MIPPPIKHLYFNTEEFEIQRKEDFFFQGYSISEGQSWKPNLSLSVLNHYISKYYIFFSEREECNLLFRIMSPGKVLNSHGIYEDTTISSTRTETTYVLFITES